MSQTALLGDDLTSQRIFGSIRHLQDAAKATTFVEAAGGIAEALYLISFACRSRLNGHQSSELLTALDAVAADAPRWREHYSPAQIVRGLQAASTIVVWCGLRGDDRNSFGDRIRDAHGYARMLRNDMHNVCLHQEIGRRARRRRENVISALISKSRERAA